MAGDVQMVMGAEIAGANVIKDSRINKMWRLSFIGVPVGSFVVCQMTCPRRGV